MINEEVVIKVSTDTTSVGKSVKDSGQAVESFEQKLKRINKEVESGDLSFRQLNKKIQEYQTIALAAGRTSVVGRQAIQQAANLKDELVDLTSEVNRLSQDGQKLQGVMQLGGSVVAGYSAFQSVTALLGVENENLTKTLVKLQAAQSLLMATEQIRASLEKESALRLQASILLDKAKAVSTGLLTTVTGTATGAMKAFRVALISTGVGALIVGVGLLVTNFKEVGAWVTKTINRFEFLQKAVEPLIWIYGKLREGLEALGIVDSKEKQAAIKNSEERIEQTKKERDEKTKAFDFEIAKRKAAGKDTIAIEKEKSEFIKQSIIAEANGILALVKLRGEYTQEQKDRMVELKNDLTKITQESALKEIEETKNAEDKKAELQKVANENAKKERERIASEKVAQLQNEQKLADELFIANQKRQMSETDFAIQEIIRGNEAKFEIAKNNAELTAQLEAEQNAQIEEVKEAERQAKLEAERIYAEEQKKIADDIMQHNYEQGLAELEAEKQIQEAKREAVQKNLDMTASVLSNFSDIAGRETQAGKTLAVASATINTYKGVSDALAATTVTPFETGLKFANAIAIGLAGMINVKKILAVNIPKSGGGGGGGGVSAPTYPRANTTQPTTGVGGVSPTEETNLKPTNNKVYIVDSEIQASNKRNSESVNFATIM